MLFANDDIVCVNDYAGNATFSSYEMDTLSVDLNGIMLVDFNFDENNSETIIHVKLMAWCKKFKQHKPFKKQFFHDTGKTFLHINIKLKNIS